MIGQILLTTNILCVTFVATFVTNFADLSVENVM